MYTEPLPLSFKKLVLVGRQKIRKHRSQAIPAIWNHAYDEETHRGYDPIEITRNIKRKGHSSLGKHQSIAQSNGGSLKFSTSWCRRWEKGTVSGAENVVCVFYPHT